MSNAFYRLGSFDAACAFMPKYANEVADHLLTVAMQEASKGAVGVEPPMSASKMRDNREGIHHGIGTLLGMTGAGALTGMVASGGHPGWTALGAGLGGALSLPLVLGSDEDKNEQSE